MDEQLDAAGQELLKSLIRKRGTLKSRITTIYSYVGTVDQSNVTDKIRRELETRSVKLDDVYRELLDVQEAIDDLYDEVPAEQTAERVANDNRYFSIASDISLVLNPTRGRVSRTGTSPGDSSRDNRHSRDHDIGDTNEINSQVRLPRIDIPKFDGTLDAWMEFRDSFISLIHERDNLSDIAKFHYLRNCLIGEAKAVINSIDFTAQNYSVAWNLVFARYDNRRILIHNHLTALFSFETIQSESAIKLRSLHDNLAKRVSALTSLGEETKNWDTLLIFIVAGKLDRRTARDWEETAILGVMPTLREFKDFLRNKADQLEALAMKRLTQESERPRGGQWTLRSVGGQARKSNTRTFVTAHGCCSMCNGDHKLMNCDKFKGLESNARIAKIRELRACLNCLIPGHFATECRSRQRCSCGRKHHELLHMCFTSNQTKLSESAVASVQQKRSGLDGNGNDKEMVVGHSFNDSEILLATALVKIMGSDGNFVMVRALLDSASQSSFITQNLVDLLGLQMQAVELTIVGVSKCKSQASSKCKVNILSTVGNYYLEQMVFVLPEITNAMPLRYLNRDRFKIPPHIIGRLADPDFNKPGKIDLLIGADAFWNLLSVGQHSLGRDLPILQKTKLGWIISGRIGNYKRGNITSCNVVQRLRLEDQIQKFWEVEGCLDENLHSKDQTACENHFTKTVYRTQKGRFVVNIPTRNLDALGCSFEQALNRFYKLELRLNRNSKLKRQYLQFMRDYETLGHMQELTDNSRVLVKPVFYLPHHPVFNFRSISTKLRVVFDGSARSDSGTSLNDCQLVGPNIQDDLFSILLRFRRYTYVLCADILKMYRQILVDSSQWQLQRILWRNNEREDVKIFELKTVTYGTAAASHLAIRCLEEIARLVEEEYPIVAKHIRKGFYVDDLNTGFDDLAEAKLVAKQLYKIFADFGMTLCKWKSNSKQVTAEFSDNGTNAIECHGFDTDANNKTLGLFWSSESDCLYYDIGNIWESPNVVTKRTILSITSQIFDPLGLLAPVIINAKILMQRLWALQLQWDESLPATLHSEWKSFCWDIQYLKGLKIKRHCLSAERNYIALHGFSDASESAYGASIYISSRSNDGTTKTSLLCAKTKVAPLQKLTVPRLELCAAYLLSRLVQRVIFATNLRFDDVILWSDSTIVLYWLETEPNRLKTFVANRVANIKRNSDGFQWRYVSTADNPADVCSRGTKAKILLKHKLWWHGPVWLSDKRLWPCFPDLQSHEVAVEFKTTLHATTIKPTELTILNIEDYSSISRLERVVAYVFRFISNCKQERRKSVLSLSEIKQARDYLIRSVQKKHFPDAMHGTLRGLFPFYDEAGLIRVGGRLKHANLDFDFKHPILLPQRSHLTLLLFRREHVRLMHIGAQGLLSAIRQTFWPIGGRVIAKRIIRECVTCFKARPRHIIPKMGQLPKARVNYSPPFSHCGVDYAGPILIKTSNLRGCRTYKAYIALFVCLSTRALHLELVTSLSTDAFLATLRRFIARRGVPADIYSDNGRNFVGARNELSSFLRRESENLISAAREINIVWHFTPPYTPHFGGLWEAGVKSVKHHLKRVIGEMKLSYEDFSTFLVQVEGILNSRPLCPLSTDPTDNAPLTPAHFLIGRPLTTVMDPLLSETRIGCLRKFQQLQLMTQHFWKRWQGEYLQQLQRATKWTRESKNVKEGTLVLMGDDHTPTLRWKLGRVTTIHPGIDGVVRAITLRTAEGTVRRSVHKVCALPIDDDIAV